MRISDWSSDVCSSDLQPAVPVQRSPSRFNSPLAPSRPRQRSAPSLAAATSITPPSDSRYAPSAHSLSAAAAGIAPNKAAISAARVKFQRLGVRSEEHTSELQSLMRISYAVFCLKQKKTKRKKKE